MTAVTTRPVTPTRRSRHRDSPRVRRLAAERGVELRAVIGTGPAGRVTTDDLTRHVSRPGAATPASRTTTGVAFVEVDVSRLPSHGTHALLAVVGRAVVDVGRRLGAACAAGGIGLEREDGAVVRVADAAYLTDEGLERRLDDVGRASPEGDPPRVAVAHGHGTTMVWAPLGPGEEVRFVLGVVVERPVVVHDDDGAPLIAVRPLVQVTVTHDAAAVDAAQAARWLVAVRDKIEQRAAGAHGTSA